MLRTAKHNLLLCFKSVRSYWLIRSVPGRGTGKSNKSSMSKHACRTTSTIRQDTFININLRWWGTKMGRQRQVNRRGAVPQVIAVIEDQLQSISTTFKYVIITTVLVFKFFPLILRVIRLHTIWLLLLFIFIQTVHNRWTWTRGGWKTEYCANLCRTCSAPCIKKCQPARIYIRWFKNS